MAKVFRTTDRIRMGLTVHKVKDCPTCNGKGVGCAGCKGFGQVRDGDTVVDKLAFIFAPYSYEQKQEILDSGQRGDGKEIFDAIGRHIRSIRVGVKGVEGLMDAQDQPWILPKGEDGNVTKEGIDTLMNFQYTPELLFALNQFLISIPERINLPGELGLRTDAEVKVLVEEQAKNFQ